MNISMKNISNYADIFVIPFFLLIFIYLYKLENKTREEIIIMFFILFALICDIIFSFIFLFN